MKMATLAVLLAAFRNFAATASTGNPMPGLVQSFRRVDLLLFQHERPFYPKNCLSGASRRRVHIRANAPASSQSSVLSSSKKQIIYSSQRILPLNRPVDPSSLKCDNPDDHESRYVFQQAKKLREWMKNKKSILCLTGAGISTESGIPDYRGNKGSYFKGHKPIIHHEYMSSELVRQRYWARSLVGYSPFANAKPNLGHKALATLEKGGWIGVEIDEDSPELNLRNNSAIWAKGTSPWESHLIDLNGNKKKLSTITQNVDILHSKAGSQHVLHLHGRGDIVRCMSCAQTLDRLDYYDKIWEWNRDWIHESISFPNDDDDGKKDLRPDGDAEWNGSYDKLKLPNCQSCNDQLLQNNGHLSADENSDIQQPFYKTDVVFFGDSVPRHRVHLSNAAIDAADGLLCIGTSLAVHSAFRLAKRAIERGVPVAILNVGETRVEREGLGTAADGSMEKSLVTKVESPIGETLAELVKMLENEQRLV